MYIYNLISITLITAPSLRPPLPLLSLQFFLVRLTLHVHGIGLWAIEILTAHITSVTRCWGGFTGRVSSVGRLVWLVFNCNRQMAFNKETGCGIHFFSITKGQLNDRFRNTNNWTTTRMLEHRASSEWSRTWVKTKPIDWHQNAWNLIEEPSCRSVALQENSGWQYYSASHTKN